jgi:hypothetical protein
VLPSDKILQVYLYLCYTIVDMALNDHAVGMHIDLSSQPPTCEHCILRKPTKSTVSKVWEGLKLDRRLEVVYVDLMGPQAVHSANRNRYSMDIIDNYSSCS